MHHKISQNRFHYYQKSEHIEINCVEPSSDNVNEEMINA